MATSAEPVSLSEWRRHGWIILPCLAGNLLCSVHSYALGAMIGPLESEFGWKRAEISAGLLVISTIAMVFAPIAGMALDRFGARRIVLPGVLLYCGALALLGTANQSILHWWVLWGLLGMANMLVAPMVWAAAINGRFDQHRGKALALALCGSSVSAIFIPSLTTALIDWQGWRGAYFTLGLISCGIVFPLVLLLFHDVSRPPEDQQRSAGMPRSRIAEVRGEMASPRFLKLAAAVALFTIALCALTTNGVPVLISEGFDRTTASGIAASTGLGSLTGRLAGGFLLDRFDAKKVAAVSVAFPVLAVLLLLHTQESQLAAISAFFVVGLSGGTELDACAYLTVRHFGMRNFGALFGMITGLILLANGVSPAGANYIYDLTGSYDIALWIVAGLFAASAVMFLTLGRYPEAEAYTPQRLQGNDR